MTMIKPITGACNHRCVQSQVRAITGAREPQTTRFNESDWGDNAQLQGENDLALSNQFLRLYGQKHM
jgi:hypothetical protein